MKKSLILGFLGVAACVATSYGQGFIALDNYDSSAHPLITYGANVPANGSSGGFGTVGAGVSGAPWTVGLFFAQGDVTGSVAADPTGIADPSTQGGGLALGSGAGSTTAMLTGAQQGQFAASSAFQATATPSGNATVTVEVVAYSGADYATSGYRGHSSAFTIATQPGTSFPNNVGDFMTGFSVLPVPEPSIFALSGLGAAALMLIRRKK